MIIVEFYMVWFHFDCIMQLKKSWHIATNVCSRKKCHYFWWSPWLLMGHTCAVEFGNHWHLFGNKTLHGLILFVNYGLDIGELGSNILVKELRMKIICKISPTLFSAKGLKRYMFQLKKSSITPMNTWVKLKTSYITLMNPWVMFSGFQVIGKERPGS